MNIGRVEFGNAFVLGILERNDRTYNAFAPNAKAKTLIKHIKKRKGPAYFINILEGICDIVCSKTGNFHP